MRMGGADIVCPVTVEMGFHIPFQQGQQCLRLCVIVRHMLVRVALCKVQFLLIALRFRQPFPDHGSCRHTGDGRFVPVVVDALGIFAQGKLHARADLHPVCHPSGGFQNCHGAAAGVGAAG